MDASQVFHYGIIGSFQCSLYTDSMFNFSFYGDEHSLKFLHHIGS